MKPTNAFRQAPMAMLVLGLLACGEDPVAPQNTSLVGNWSFVGFTDGSRVGSTTGTWVFFDDGVMAVDISITFANEGTNLIAAVGSFERMDHSVTFELSGPLSSWDLAFTGPEVLLTQTAPDPADNTITLRRVGADALVGPRSARPPTLTAGYAGAR